MNPNDEMLGATLGIVKLPPPIPDDRGGIAVWIMTFVEWVCLHQLPSRSVSTAETNSPEHGRPASLSPDAKVRSDTIGTI